MPTTVHMVTIEGVAPGCPALAPGARVTTTRTTFVRNLLRYGYAREVETHEELVMSAPPADTTPARPTRRASKSAWRGYLTARGIPWHEDMTRDALIALDHDEDARE